MSDPIVAPYVVPKNSLNRSLHRAEIINKIVDRVQKLPDYRQYKDDLETLLFICLLAEHLVVNKKGEKIDKKQLVIECCEKIFGQVNKDLISKNVEFLFENKRIKKVSIVSLVCGTLSEWFSRKIA